MRNRTSSLLLRLRRNWRKATRSRLLSWWRGRRCMRKSSLS